PPASVNVTVGVVPSGTLTKPAPSPVFCFTVTVNVCGSVTRFVPFGPIVMLASTNVFTAGPLPPGPAPTLAVDGSVSRFSVTPPTVMVTAALPVALPADGDVNVTAHWPLTVPGDAHVSEPSWLAAPFEFVSVTTGFVPPGPLSTPAPSPAFCFTVTVNVWFWPTSLVALGVIVMLASTNV